MIGGDEAGGGSQFSRLQHVRAVNNLGRLFLTDVPMTSACIYIYVCVCVCV